LRDGDACPRWPLRLPVAAPSWLDGVAAAAGACAAACLMLTLFLLDAPRVLAAVVAVLSAAAARWAWRRPAVPVGGLKADPDPAGWQVLLESGWRGARLRDCRRGAGWLALSLDLDDVSAAAGAARTLAVTVWRPQLTAAAWRRLGVAVGLGAMRVPVSGRPA